MMIEMNKYQYLWKIIFESNTRFIISGDDVYTSKWQMTRNNIKYIDHLFLYTDMINVVHVGSKMYKLLVRIY